jgi:hypothetical protein
MAGRNAGIAAAFTAMGILGLAVLNFLFSPGYIWFYYPAFAALWWPLAAWLIPRRNLVGFALAGSILTIGFLAAVNLQNSPEHLWFLYAVGPLAWWPVGMYFKSHSRLRSLSLAGSALMIAYFIAVNLFLSPGHMWFLYACYPFVWWPIVMYLGRKAGTLAFALVCSAVTIAYYAALNLLLSPGYPWAVYPAFAVAWWPLSMYFAKKRQWIGYSFAASALAIAFFIIVNLVSSPGVNWAIYPIFAVLWWPMAMLAARRKSWLGFALAGAALTVAFFTYVNLITSPDVNWAIYPIFAVLWWPLSVWAARKKSALVFAVTGAAMTAAFFVLVNMLTSPGVPWAVFPIFAVLWWPLSVFFFRKKRA